MDNEFRVKRLDGLNDIHCTTEFNVCTLNIEQPIHYFKLSNQK